MGADLFSTDRLHVVRFRGELHVTNGHWFKPLTASAEGATQPTFEEAFTAAEAGSSLRFVGCLNTGSRPVAVWRRDDEPAFTVLIDWRYHQGLGLEALNLRAAGPQSLVLAFEKSGALAAGVMPFTAGSTEGWLIEADALLARLEGEEGEGGDA